MKNKLILSLILICISTTLLASTNLSLSLDQTFRVNNELFYEHSDLQLKYKLGQNIDIFTDYRLVYQEKLDKDALRNVFMFGGNLKTTPNEYGQLALRSRVEVGLQNNVKTTLLETEMLRYYFPWEFTNLKFRPYIGNEFGFNGRNGMEFVRNRTYFGVDFKISKKIKSAVSYFIESSKVKNVWNESGIWETSIKYEF